MKKVFFAFIFILSLLFIQETLAATIDGPANVRINPNGTVIMSLYDNAEVEIVSAENNWYLIQLDLLINKYQMNDIGYVKKGAILRDINGNNVGKATDNFKVVVSHSIREINIAKVRAYTYKSNIKTSISTKDPLTLINWRVDINYEFSYNPAIKGDLIYVNTKSGIYVLDVNTGNILHTFDSVGLIKSYSDAIIFAPKYKYIAHDPRNGNIIGSWSRHIRWETGLLKYNNNLITETAHYNSCIRSYDIESGDLVWNTSESICNYQIHGDTLYIVIDNVINVIDIATGKKRWSFKSGSDYWCAPIAISDELVFTISYHTLGWDSQNGMYDYFSLHAIDRKTGIEKWRYKDSTPFHTPSVVDNLLVFANKMSLYMLDLDSGQEWQYNFDGVITTGPVIYKDTVIVGVNRSLYALPISEIKKHRGAIPFVQGNGDSGTNYDPIITKRGNLIIEEYKMFPKRLGSTILGMESFSLPDIIRNRINERRIEKQQSLKPPYYNGKLLTVMQSKGGNYTIKQGSQPLLLIDNVEWPFDNPIRRFYYADNNWILEVIRSRLDENENKRHDGTVYVNGVNINEKGKYKEVFNYIYIGNRPFYFFEDETNHIGISYDGKIATLQYEIVPHYQCCGQRGENPKIDSNMIRFWGYRDGWWYYVVAGVYD